MTFPIMWVVGEPSSWALMKSPAAGMNVSSVPATTPGSESGSVTRRKAFLRVTLPLSLPGVVAGTLLTFIPAAGDFINAQLLGSPTTHMIGNVINEKFNFLIDYPAAASMSIVLMPGILVAVLAYARTVGTEKLTG